jgi:tetraacyldisaccharide 4'-kinase
MGERVHRAALHWWSGEATGIGWSLLTLAATPAEWGFRVGVGARSAAYDRGWFPARPGPVPVISVGNLSVGGTGKTPVAAYVVGLLEAQGRRPGLVARGYGEDELTLHGRWHPGTPVVADPDRVMGVGRAAEEGADVVVLDDGFQHRRLARDLDLVVVAAEQGLPGRLLPRGPFREPRSALSRADHVIVTRKSASAARAVALEGEIRAGWPDLPVTRIRLAPAGWTDLDGHPASPPDGPLLAVCSIGRPDTFAGLVAETLGREAELLPFPDHHRFTEGDVEKIAGHVPRGGALVVTEKDAVKLLRFRDSLPGARVLILQVEIESGGETLIDAIRSTVA